MESKMFMLVVVCFVLVQGRSIENSKLNGELLSKFLSRYAGEDTKRMSPPELLSRPEQLQIGEAGPIGKIQLLLAQLAQTLDEFKGDNGEDGSFSEENDESLPQELDDIASEITSLSEKVNALLEPSSTVMNSLSSLHEALSAIFGEDFDEVFMSKFLEDLSLYDVPEWSTEETSTGNYVMLPPPAQQLEMIKEYLKVINLGIDQMISSSWYSERFAQSMLYALSVVAQESNQSAESAESPETTESEDSAESPETTTQSSESVESGETLLSAENSTQTVESEESTEATESEEISAESAETLPSATESPLKREEEILRRRLMSLLIKNYSLAPSQ